MKSILTILILLFSVSSFAFPKYQTWEGRYTRHVYIEGLKKDLFQQYKVKPSRGPKFGQDADFISSIVNEDFYERHTYWSESGYPTNKCPSFSEEDFENAFESGYGLKWKSVKKIKGSKRTVFYLATYTITISTNSKSCTYEQGSEKHYVFLNKVVKGNPVYLGYLSKHPKKKK